MFGDLFKFVYLSADVWLSQIRCRVHALNILRLIILDAPLAKEVGPFIGQAIISSIIGYYDIAWAVRNSSNMVFAAAMLRKIDADKNAKGSDATSLNAIAAAELFRSYPALPAFLTAVLNSEADGCHEIRQGMWTPPAFPILLLLSRIQPIRNSGNESRELTEPFIYAIFQNLRNKHQALRRTASIALSNLCSGSDEESVSSAGAMLGGCHSMLVEALASKDWNSAHGALLAIQALSKNFRETKALLQESGLLSFFLHVSKVGLHRQPWPQICTSLALEIFAAAASGENPDEQKQIETNCRGIIVSLEESPGMVAGASELAFTAGLEMCRQLVPRVWDLSSSKEDDEVAMSKLSKLLSSTNDVRLHAIKAVKKTIYENVDRCVVQMGSRPQETAARLHEVLNIFLDALCLELSRNDELGPHPPSLRRLSRCLLECVRSSFRIDEITRINSTGLWAHQVERIVDASKSLIMKDCWLENDGFCRETPSSGNGVELMAFAVAWNLQHPEDSTEGLTTYFVAKIGELNDPRLSWRLRHSAAVAVESSGLLGWNGTADAMKQLQHKVIEEVLQMLQDPDPDVRSAASRAAQEIGDFNSISNFPLVSQCVLEQTYEHAYRPPNDAAASSSIVDSVIGLLTSIQTRCKGLEVKVAMVQNELWHTESRVDLDKLLNVGTERKIFEDEIANTHEEPLLAAQLAICIIIRLSSATLPDRASAVTNDLINQCEMMLRILERIPRAGRARDLLHAVTRSNIIFVEIHILFTVSAAILFLGGGRSTKVKELAGHVLSLDSADSNLHPSIKTALRVLSTMETGSNNGRTELLACLFLLPTKMRKGIARGRATLLR
jgi:Putative death-receptor fusion protein (DUF2428)